MLGLAGGCDCRALGIEMRGVWEETKTNSGPPRDLVCFGRWSSPLPPPKLSRTRLSDGSAPTACSGDCFSAAASPTPLHQARTKRVLASSSLPLPPRALPTLRIPALPRRTSICLPNIPPDPPKRSSVPSPTPPLHTSSSPPPPSPTPAPSSPSASPALPPPPPAHQASPNPSLPHPPL